MLWAFCEKEPIRLGIQGVQHETCSLAALEGCGLYVHSSAHLVKSHQKKDVPVHLASVYLYCGMK